MRVLALLLLLSLPARADEYERKLFGLAATNGGDAFQQDKAPEGFVVWLKNKGQDPAKLDNHKAYLEYQVYKTSLPLPPFGSKDSASLLDIWGKHLGGGSLFEKADKTKRGLTIHGFDLGSGTDFDRESEEPYISEGADRLLDWDVRLKLRQDSLGFKAKYRHPETVEQLTVEFKSYTDTPEEFGLEKVRDKIFSWFGREPKKDKSGYDVKAAVVADEHWGFTLAQGETETDEAWRRYASLGAGYTPLGRNEGEKWNYTVFGSLNHVDRESLETSREAGFGYSAGVAWSRVLDDLPIPGVGDYIWLDRARASVAVSDSELDPFSIRAAAGASAYITKHLRFSCEAGCTYTFKTEELDFDTSTGFDVKF